VHRTEHLGVAAERLWTKSRESFYYHPFWRSSKDESEPRASQMLVFRPLPSKLREPPSLRNWMARRLLGWLVMRTKYRKIQTILLPKGKPGRMDGHVSHFERSSLSNRWACGAIKVAPRGLSRIDNAEVGAAL
jgi:hypothetical protein